MKLSYRFVTGHVEIEVADEWGHAVLEQDRLLYNNDQKERRRHVSMDMMEQEQGVQFEAPATKQNDELENAMDQLPVQQRKLLQRVFWGGETLAAIAQAEGVSKMALTNRMKRALATLQKKF